MTRRIDADGAGGASALRAPLSPARDLVFPGLARCIRLHGGGDVEDALAQVLRGWAPVPAAGVSRRRVLATVRPDGRGHAVTSAWADGVQRGLTAVSAACALVADLSQEFFETRPGWLALHCGAFRLRDRLVVLTGPARAGKSTLVARLAAEPDIEVFCDDVLPVGPDGLALALGVAPRLRLPLPQDAGAAFRACVAAHMGPQDGRYGYLCAPNVVAHGTTARPSAFVVLDRRDAGAARLHRMAPDEALHHLLQRNMADLARADAAFAAAHDLTAGMTCVKLVYADLEDAVRLLRRAFGGATALDTAVDVGPPLAWRNVDHQTARAVGRHLVWEWAPGVVLRRHGESAFLWRPEDAVIWHLNAVGAAVWALLEQPGSATDIAADLAELFPGVAQDTLLRDSARLLGALRRKGLIRRYSSSIV